jgi:hypothetical protein
LWRNETRLRRVGAARAARSHPYASALLDNAAPYPRIPL